MFKINQEPLIKKEKSSNNLSIKKYLTIVIGIILISIGVSQCLGLIEFHSKEKQLLKRYQNNEQLTELEKFELCEWLSENKSYEKEFKEICESKLDTAVSGGAKYKEEFIKILSLDTNINSKIINSKEITDLYKNIKPLVQNRNMYERNLVYYTSINLWKQINQEFPNGFVYSTSNKEYKIQISVERFLHIALKHQVFDNYLNFSKSLKITQFETENYKFSLKDILWSIETIFRSLDSTTLHRYTTTYAQGGNRFELFVTYLNTAKEQENYRIIFTNDRNTITIYTFYRDNTTAFDSIVQNNNLLKEQLSKFQPNYFIYTKP